MPYESVTPLSAVMSTYVNNRITSYDRLAQRIAYQIGAPLVILEAHTNAINEFISIACELFTKYAGYTEEFLVFDSTIYEPYKGIRLDLIFSLSPYINALFNNTDTLATNLTSVSSAAFDYDLNDYRKVISVWSFEEGQSSGINTLFTIEQSLAQQTYFAYSMGNYGFDLVSWYTMKEWLKTREKVLATIPYFQFHPETQYLTLTPDPGAQNIQYMGCIGCYVEKPIKDLVKEQWVQQYALALTKIAVGHTRGKFAGTPLFGNGTVNYSDLLSQGLTEKDKLEQMLFTGASAGFGDAAPPAFFFG